MIRIKSLIPYSKWEHEAHINGLVLDLTRDFPLKSCVPSPILHLMDQLLFGCLGHTAFYDKLVS